MNCRLPKRREFRRSNMRKTKLECWKKNAPEFANDAAHRHGWPHHPWKKRPQTDECRCWQLCHSADIPAALGEGNSLSGADILNRMFKSGPYRSKTTGNVN